MEKKNNIFYLSGSLISVIIIIIALTYAIYTRKSSEELLTGDLFIEQTNQEEQTETASNPVEKPLSDDVELIEIESEKIETNHNKTTSTVTQETKQTIEEESIPDPTFIMPLEGEILRDYAKDKLVYSVTLKEWVTHLGIDIKAPKTTIVKSAEKGIIKAIKNDPRYGLSVVIQHDNGYSTVYANLLTAEFVTVGEEVDKGETIGTVGNTASFEILDEPHLHFEIMKDGVQVDPNMYL